MPGFMSGFFYYILHNKFFFTHYKFMIVKKRKTFILILLAFLMLFSIQSTRTYAYSEEIFLGGMPAGFSLYTRGAIVVGVCDVITENGLISPSKNAGIEVGDIILYIDEIEINNAIDIERALKTNQTKMVTISRNNELILEKIIPAKDINGHYKLGVFVRDDVSGIGTITYIKGNSFGSLGHPILDDRGNLLDITGGKLYNCNITGYVKGERGKAGELRGVFLRNKSVGEIDLNTNVGVFGKLNSNFDKSSLVKVKLGHAKMGDAKIFSTINGSAPKEYSISIIKVDNNIDTKNFVVKITDPDLTDCTAGIVQGMSGSPIVQDGKLVGAITHVFINDPTRGFGISIDKMFNN